MLIVAHADDERDTLFQRLGRLQVRGRKERKHCNKKAMRGVWPSGMAG